MPVEKKPKFKIELKGGFIMISLGRLTMAEAVKELDKKFNIHYTRKPFACLKFTNELYKEALKLNDEETEGTLL